MSHLILAIVLFIFGYLIKYKQWSFLISGFNISSKEKKEKYDETALCNAVGKLLFILGGILIISSFGLLFEISWITSFSWILFIVISVLFIIYSNTGNRYKK
ncbi:DUF3784 domain-containing protein [Clostridium sp. D2Q-11]|uniref:DUF3784 domain-containing protein n=1 Tax=Anaeromonas frigoriresistens TaxID=2683708 RepID=A0A942UTZ7_9FIRM|nr:DUF3784 domain-containing protein [Anaeromonas frigoriresistens]MBS4539204.1 DUF3784 domain-containing protein [Anaeromonas frigoriresistens]